MPSHGDSVNRPLARIARCSCRTLHPQDHRAGTGASIGVRCGRTPLQTADTTQNEAQTPASRISSAPKIRSKTYHFTPKAKFASHSISIRLQLKLSRLRVNSDANRHKKKITAGFPLRPAFRTHHIPIHESSFFFGAECHGQVPGLQTHSARRFAPMTNWKLFVTVKHIKKSLSLSRSRPHSNEFSWRIDQERMPGPSMPTAGIDGAQTRKRQRKAPARDGEG